MRNIVYFIDRAFSHIRVLDSLTVKMSIIKYHSQGLRSVVMGCTLAHRNLLSTKEQIDAHRALNRRAAYYILLQLIVSVSHRFLFILCVINIFLFVLDDSLTS